MREALEVLRRQQALVLAHIPANRAVNNQGEGTFFDRTSFAYDEASDTIEKPQFLLRGRWGAGTEMSLATLVWNLKRAMAVVGKVALTERLAQPRTEISRAPKLENENAPQSEASL